MRLNIIFISSIKFIGGTEIWMVSVIKELLKRGHSVLLICPNDAAIKQRAIDNGIEVTTLTFKYDFDPFVIFRLVKIIKERKTDVIITNVLKELRLSGAAAKLSGKAKVIAMRHVDKPIGNNLYYRFTYNTLADQIVTNSFATRDTMLLSAGWLNSEKIKVIYYGIDSSVFQDSQTSIRKELDISDNEPVIGFIGRLRVQKGIVYMMQAFKLLKQKIPRARLVIAGVGNLKNEIIDKAAEFGYSDSIHLLGFREDIPRILQTIDLLLLPSLWEGFGLVLVEAMAAGKPCVATRTSSIPEIVEDGRSGFTVRPKDSVALADACFKILSNPHLAESMGKEGRRIVNEKFPLQKMIDEYEKLYLNLCDKAKS